MRLSPGEKEQTGSQRNMKSVTHEENRMLHYCVKCGSEEKDTEKRRQKRFIAVADDSIYEHCHKRIKHQRAYKGVCCAQASVKRG